MELYRVYGGKVEALGNYWTPVKPLGQLQSQIDLALKPEWGNTADLMTTILVPKGEIIYQGIASSQGSLVGGGMQVYIPKVRSEWVIK